MTWKGELVRLAAYSLMVLILAACVAPAARQPLTETANVTQEARSTSQLDLPEEPVVFSPPEHNSYPILREESSFQILLYDIRNDTLQAITDNSSQIWWRPGTATAATVIDGHFTLYDASGGTWSSSDISGADIGAWSPDGSLFAFGSRPSPGPPPLRILDVERHRLLTTPAIGYPVRWSPDGARLLVAWPGGRAILHLRPEVRLTELVPDDSSHNERWLDAYRLAYLGGQNIPVVKILDISSDTPTTVVEERVPHRIGVFSPDGRQLAVNVPAPQRQDGVALFFLPPFQQINTVPNASVGTYLSLEDRWSPDSRRLLVLRDQCSPGERLVALDVETGGEVTLGRAGVFRAIWSPDGRWVAYTERRSLYLVPSDGSSDPQLIFDHVAAPSEPKWSTDSRFVAFNKFTGGYGLCE